MIPATMEAHLSMTEYILIITHSPHAYRFEDRDDVRIVRPGAALTGLPVRKIILDQSLPLMGRDRNWLHTVALLRLMPHGVLVECDPEEIEAEVLKD